MLIMVYVIAQRFALVYVLFFAYVDVLVSTIVQATV